MRTSRVLLLGSSIVAAAALVFGLADLARAISPRDRHFSSTRHGIAVEAPAGWTLSQHTGYGDTIVLLLHPDGSRISLSAAPTTATDATALFEQNRKGLIAQKLSPSAPQPGPRGFLTVDIVTPDRPDRLRQLYLVRPTPIGKQAVILTLVGRAAGFAEHTSALEFVANRMTLEDPAPSPTAAAPTSKGGVVPKLALTDLGVAGGGGGAGGGPPTAAQPSAGASSPSAADPAAAGGSAGQLRRHGR